MQYLDEVYHNTRGSLRAIREYGHLSAIGPIFRFDPLQRGAADLEIAHSYNTLFHEQVQNPQSKTIQYASGRPKV